MTFIIKTAKGYVSKFDASMGVVSCCDAEYKQQYAKKFKTEKSAENFIKNYADCGCGMSAAGTTIENA